LSEKVKTIVQDVDQLVERINREENLPKASEVVQSINEMQAQNVTIWSCGNAFSKLMNGLLKPLRRTAAPRSMARTYDAGNA
jgi:hypothetical protein